MQLGRKGLEPGENGPEAPLLLGLDELPGTDAGGADRGAVPFLGPQEGLPGLVRVQIRPLVSKLYSVAFLRFSGEGTRGGLAINTWDPLSCFSQRSAVFSGSILFK